MDILKWTEEEAEEVRKYNEQLLEEVRERSRTNPFLKAFKEVERQKKLKEDGEGKK